MDSGSGNIYGPGNQSLTGANQNYDTLGGQNFAAINGYAPQTAGTARNIVQQGTSNPYTGQAQTGANTASAYGTGTLAPQLQQGATDLSGLGSLNAGYVGQALQTGFDPQNANYNRLFQRGQDQQNAINAMSGVSNTPYGAGVSGDAARDFNLDWLASQGQRQQTAAGTAGALTGNAVNAFTGAGNVGNAAITTGATAGALPSDTYNKNLMDQLKLLIGGNTAVSGAVGPGNDLQSQILQYLGYGTDATNTKQQESDKTMQGIGQTAGSLASLAFLL